MRLINTLFAHKVGELTKLYSNLPESYIKRATDQVYWKTPRGLPNYLPRTVERKKFRASANAPWTSAFRQQNAPGRLNKKVFLEPVGEWSFFKGDRVEIMVGKDKGKQGIISQVVQERNWVFVEGLNAHHRRVGKEANFPGIIIKSEAPLLVTGHVKLVDPETLKATDVDWRFTEEGEKVRVSTTTRRVIPIPALAYETKDYKTKSAYLENPTKDTKSEVIGKITFQPMLKTFEMDIMENMNIVEDRIPAPTFWY